MRNLHDSYTLGCTCSTCPISDTSSNYPKRLGSDNQINKWTLIGTLTVTYPGPCPMTPYEDLLQSILSQQPYRDTVFVVYYESIKWEIQTKPICECRCDERLKTRVEESTRLTWTQLVGELELKDRDEVNRRDVCEWDGWLCVLDVIVVSCRQC